LAAELEALIARAPQAGQLAVTMTGELCDCFRDKAEGVRHILSAVNQAAGNREVAVYQVDGQFVPTAAAAAQPQLTAASNWHALAAFAGHYAPKGTAILIDVGSTTTDIIPLVDGRVAARGSTDLQRLAYGELLYRGVKRTPICALRHTLPWNGQACPVAAEVFATTADAYVLLGSIEEEPDAGWTADGKPLTNGHARQRLARQLCADVSELGADAIDGIARAVRDYQLAELTVSIRSATAKLPAAPAIFITSGSGEFLAREALAAATNVLCLSLQAEFGVQAGECAPAHAVAVLAKEQKKTPHLHTV
jgi:(4-(4-[2-(gamma-L-glutamylamino)ethyl]phenoxymethyl)furan-2-yl)methanamine synthase